MMRIVNISVSISVSSQIKEEIVRKEIEDKIWDVILEYDKLDVPNEECQFLSVKLD